MDLVAKDWTDTILQVVNGSTAFSESNVTEEAITKSTVFAYSTSISVLLIIVFVIVITWVILGNLTVILAVINSTALRQSPSNILVANLALSDLLLGVMVLPLSAIVELLGDWPFPKETCFFWLMIDVLICTASIWGLVVIATDRYTATFYPMWYRTRYRSQRIMLYISTVWVISTLTTIPPLTGFGGLLQNSYQTNNETAICALSVDIHFASYSSAMTFIVPTIFLFLLYGRIFLEIRKRSQEMARMKHKVKESIIGLGNNKEQLDQELEELENAEPISSNDDSTSESHPLKSPPTTSPNTEEIELSKVTSVRLKQHSLEGKMPSAGDHQMSILKRMTNKRKKDKKEERATKIMLTIMMFFIVCWLPFFILYIVVSALGPARQEQVPPQLQVVLTWLGYLNSAGNPVLYVAFNRQFREGFISVWCSKFQRLTGHRRTMH